MGVIPGPSTANILAGDNSASLLVPIFNDFFPEETEEFTVSLTNPSQGSISTAFGTATCLINDEDGKGCIIF
jgi:hypothetical protein